MLVLLASCTRPPAWFTDALKRKPRPADIMATNHQAARDMAGQIKETVLPGDLVLTASFVNLDDLSETSSFGRLVSEQIADGLAEREIAIVEMKLRSQAILVVNGSGEFALNREALGHVGLDQAKAVLAGTYLVTKNQVIVSARIIRTSDKVVLAAHDYALPLDYNLRQLLDKNTYPEYVQPSVITSLNAGPPPMPEEQRPLGPEDEPSPSLTPETPASEDR